MQKLDFHQPPRVAQAVLEEAQACLLGQVQVMRPGQVRVILVQRKAGHGRALEETKTTEVVWTVDAGLEDRQVLRRHGRVALRRVRIQRLLGEQGDRLRHIAVQGGHAHRIASAIDRLRQEFDQPHRIDDIAQELGMSVSSFHHHFKAVTAMSPLQFQKQMRLQEARRLMLGEGLDAAAAGYRVGYNDASHFNREYKRLFSLPPLRDVERMREAAT